MSGRHYFSQFEEDPFFGLPKDRFSSFEDFFSNDPFHRPSRHALEGPRDRGMERAVERHDSRRNPFSWCSDMFGGFDRTFRGLHEQMGRTQDDPDAHTYSHSSVMTYSAGDDGQPKYYEATSSSRNAPGGIRETRKTVRDSERELSKMAVGRHIGDRGHVMEKSENTRTGQREEKQDFLSLEQNDMEKFDREWKEKTRTFRTPGGAGGALPDNTRREARAIEGKEKK